MVLLLTCVVAHAVGISTWLARDRAQPAGEIARYGIQTLRVANALAHPSADLAERVLMAHPEPQPPLLACVASLFHLAAPENPDAPVLAQTLFVAIAAAGAFALGMALRGPGTGVLAAVLFTSTTFTAVYEHRLLPDLPLAAFAVCAAAAFVTSDGFRGRAASVSLGVFAGLGMLTHWNFAFACAGIGAGFLLTFVYCILRLTSGEGDRAAARTRMIHALLALASCAVVAGPWAIARGAEAWRYAAGGAPDWSLKGFLWYGDALRMESSLMIVIFTMIAAALFVISIFVKKGAANPLAPASNSRAWNCILTIAGAWIALALAPSRDARYAGLFLPSLCAMIAFVLAGLRFAVVRVPVVAAVVVLSGVSWLAVGFEVFASDDPRVRPVQTLQIGSYDFRAYQPSPAPPSMEPAPGRTLFALTTVKNPPDARDPDPFRALGAIDRDITDRKGRVFVVTPQEWMHGSAIEYWCEANFPKLTPLLLREYYAGDPKPLEFAAFSPYEFLVSHYVLVVRRRGGPTDSERAAFPFNQAFLQYLTGEAPKFRAHFTRMTAYEPVVTPWDRPNDLIVEIYKRIGAADVAEVQEVLAAVARFDRVKPGTWVDIAYFWLHQGRAADARKILDTNVKNPGVLAPVHRDRYAQVLQATSNLKQ